MYILPPSISKKIEGYRWQSFTPPAAGKSRRFRGLICHRRSQGQSLITRIFDDGNQFHHPRRPLSDDQSELRTVAAQRIDHHGALTDQQLTGPVQHQTLRLAHDTGALKKSDLARVMVDTTVQPKNITFPTDAKLLETAIHHLGKLPGSPYDGHTLKDVIAETEPLTGRAIERAYVDAGNRGHDVPRPGRVFRSGQKRGVHGQIKKELRRRSAIEAVIGHCKTDGHLGRNFLKGRSGDTINAVMSAVGYPTMGHRTSACPSSYRKRLDSICRPRPASFGTLTKPLSKPASSELRSTASPAPGRHPPDLTHPSWTRGKCSAKDKVVKSGTLIRRKSGEDDDSGRRGEEPPYPTECAATQARIFRQTRYRTLGSAPLSPALSLEIEKLKNC